VRLACRDYAVESKPLLLGIWGGTDEDDRAPMRRRRTA